MNFVEYGKLINSADSAKLVEIKTKFPLAEEWVVTEKIHGIHYSIWADRYNDKTTMIAGKRRSFIEKDEKFFNHETVFEKYSKAVFQISREVKRDIVVYGELFGGKYGDKQVGIQLHKGVEYCPNLEFMAYDMAIIEGATALKPTLKFMPYDEFVSYCTKYKLPYVPQLFKGTLNDCLAFNTDINTIVPNYFDLEPVEDNKAKGVVIRPVISCTLEDGERVLFKKKNPSFRERHKQRVQKTAKPLNLTQNLVTIIDSLKNCFTTTRVYGILDKHGQTIDFGKVCKYLLEDSINEVCKESYAALSNDDKHLVNKACDKTLAQTVKSSLYADNYQKVG